MKKIIFRRNLLFLPSLIVVSILISCNKISVPKSGVNFQQVNLVSDTSSFGAATIDSNLGNPWGIAIDSTGIFWIATNYTGSTVICYQ